MYAYALIAAIFVANFATMINCSEHESGIDEAWQSPNSGLYFSEDGPENLIRALRSALDKPSKSRYFPYYKGLGRK